jgi:hypothetical protein
MDVSSKKKKNKNPTYNATINRPFFLPLIGLRNNKQLIFIVILRGLVNLSTVNLFSPNKYYLFRYIVFSVSKHGGYVHFHHYLRRRRRH